MAGREQLHQLLLDAAAGHWTGQKCYIYNLSRLGRNEADSFTTLEELEEYGIEVISCQEGRDKISRGLHIIMNAHFSETWR